MAHVPKSEIHAELGRQDKIFAVNGEALYT